MNRSRQALPRLILLVVVPLLAIAGAGYWWLSGGRYVGTENAYVKAHIVQIATEVAGTVRRVPVHDHATVSAAHHRIGPHQSNWRTPKRGRTMPSASGSARRNWRPRASSPPASATNRRTRLTPRPIAWPRCVPNCAAC